MDKVKVLARWLDNQLFLVKLFLTIILLMSFLCAVLVHNNLIYLENNNSQIEKISTDLFRQVEKNRELMDENEMLKDSISRIHNVTVSVYNAEPEQCNEDPYHTASMFKLDSVNQYKHKIIAVSRDLLDKYPMGTKVAVNGTAYDGKYTVQDKMNKRFKNRIDLLINKDMPIGIWKNVIITKI